MPLVTANRDAPEGIAPAHRNGSGRHPDPDTPPPDRLTAHGLEAIDQVVSQAELGPLPPDRYLDREESWLRFNQRVLELAEDDTVPLLERVRFLAIFASNLDEFFMVRVAGLMRRMAAGLPVEGVSAPAPRPGAEPDPGADRPADRPARGLLQRAGPARAERPGHRDPALEGAVLRRAGQPARAVP